MYRRGFGLRKMIRRARGIFLVLLSLPIVLVLLWPMRAAMAARMAATPEPPRGARQAHHAETGKLRFLGTDPGQPLVLDVPGMRGMSPDARGMVALQRYGPAFGLRDPQREVRLLREKRDRRGRQVVRYQQTYQGVPVLAGEIIVQLTDRGDLIAMLGEVAPDLNLDVAPRLASYQAAAIALEGTSKWHAVPGSELQTNQPTLWIYDPRLLGPGGGLPRLVWRVEVSGRQPMPIRELVLVDARNGGIALHFNQVDTALYREIYDNANDPNQGLPGLGPYRVEGDPPYGLVPDVDYAYDYSGDTYDFYFTLHGRDSIDNAGMALISTTRYCHPSYSCPFANAFWNGSQMVYGDGYASADDVVGHELTHGVTDYESNLFYYYQSGAINESFSDLWGEFVDQWNGAGSDGPGDKWLIGEDLPIGAIRSMSDPPAFNNPDKMTSPLYETTSYDYGGVHINSGVNNKAAYLMTDGGTFNGYTIQGLGLNKVAAIYYEVQTSLLTSGSDYADLYQALFQACYNLVGGPEGITAADCQEVRKATDAVEMNLQPVAGYNPEADLCPAGQTAITYWYDDFEGGMPSWTFGAAPGSIWAWSYATGYATSGSTMLKGDDSYLNNDAYAAMPSAVNLATGASAYLHFKHAYGFEGPDYDGGWLEISIDGGAWADAGGYFDQGKGYDGPLNSSNPNAGQSAFLDDSHGYVSSRYDLSTLAGSSVRFRWRMSTDNVGSDMGWFLDDVRVYKCVVLGQQVYMPLIKK